MWKHILEWTNNKILFTLTYKMDLRRQYSSLQLFSAKHPNTARVTCKKLCICREIHTTRIRGNINSVVSRHKFTLFFFFFENVVITIAPTELMKSTIQRIWTLCSLCLMDNFAGERQADGPAHAYFLNSGPTFQRYQRWMHCENTNPLFP